MNMMQMKFALSKTVITFGVIATLASASAYAQRDHAYDIVYYSDASHSEEVGRKSFTCSPGSAMEGIVTAFYKSEVTVADCNAGLPVWPSNPLEPIYWPGW